MSQVYAFLEKKSEDRDRGGQNSGGGRAARAGGWWGTVTGALGALRGQAAVYHGEHTRSGARSSSATRNVCSDDDR